MDNTPIGTGVLEASTIVGKDRLVHLSMDRTYAGAEEASCSFQA